MAKEARLVVVEWEDSRFFASTRTIEDIQALNLATFESVGYLVYQDERTTAVAAERNELGEYRDVTLIPTRTVSSIRSLSPNGRQRARVARPSS